MSERYIGIMSGTSMDGIDAVLVDFAEQTPRLLAKHHQSYPQALRQALLALCRPGDNELYRYGQLDVRLARHYAEAVQALIKAHGLKPSDITAIGCHGQTVRHHPESDPPFTLQLGDPNTLAELSGISTVMDLRRHDMAAGGQGAPLVPAFHAALFQREGIERCIVNIGGMANITLLPGENTRPVSGFDTGPGNVLLDAWIEEQQGKSLDENGAWAGQGRVDRGLLETLLSDPYFQRPPPKSTGREYFNLAWLNKRLDQQSPVDVQATLVELTARSIAQAITEQGTATQEVLICGGGAFNPVLLNAIRNHLPHSSVDTTAAFDVDPQWIEAMAFAWLARQRCLELPGSLPAVTGAKRPVVLGGLYSPH